MKSVKHRVIELLRVTVGVCVLHTKFTTRGSLEVFDALIVGVNVVVVNLFNTSTCAVLDIILETKEYECNAKNCN